MTHAIAKDRVRKAIEGTLNDNKKLYRMLEKYDEKAEPQPTRAA